MKSREGIKARIVVRCCLLASLLLSAWAVRSGRATSQVHSVWLEAGPSSPRPDPTGNSQRVFSHRTGLWSVASSDQLTNSASSLQPTIAALDADNSANRRLDFEPTVSYVSNASKLDPTIKSDWLQGERAAGNETNNGQVHFDEDQRPARPPASNQGEQDDLISTELNNNTNSQSNAVGFEDFVRVISNSNTNPDTNPVSSNSENQTSLTSIGLDNEGSNRKSPDADRRPPSFIYYLSDSDRWQQPRSKPLATSNHYNQLEDPPNQPASHSSLPSSRLSPSTDSPPAELSNGSWRPHQATSSTGNSRRKLHNSGTQYDLRESHGLPSGADEVESSHRRRAADQHQTERDLIRFVDQLTTSSRRPDSAQFQLTTPLPQILQINHRVRQKQPLVVQAPLAYGSALDGPLFVKHPHVYPQLLQPGHYYLDTVQASGATSRRPHNHRGAQQQDRAQIWPQRAALSPSKNSWLDPQTAQRSFLRNYVRPSDGYRPKLKPAGILSSWISSTGGRTRGNAPLENSIYLTSDRSPATFRQPPWNSANYHYNYELLAGSSPALGQLPQGGHLYTLLHPGASNGNGSGNKKSPQHYHGPTLAPAASYIHRTRPEVAQASSMRGQQQQGAGFIPVVALSVTKTSPMPVPMAMPAAYSNQMTEVSAEQPSVEMDTPSDFPPPPSLASKRRDRNQQQARVHFDDFGNFASGSSGKPSTMSGNQPRMAYQTPVETTTVKSALFGYLPHEVERPLLGAMNLISPLQQQLAFDGNRPRALYRNPQHLGELSSVLQGLDEPPTPLGLQLQANSYAQNDIAHPLGSAALESGPDQRAPLFYLESLPSTTSSRPTKHDLPILQSAQGLMSALLADGSLGSAQLMAAASELNPLMPVMFAAPQQSSASSQSHDEPSESTQEADRYQPQQQQQVEPTRASSALQNKGNRKRSGDFFASAGQLLLSALPLLLAPTLGLMFASTPNAVARYQGQNPFGAESSGIQTGAVPGSYMSGLNQGAVSNASPAPIVFTPTPPLSSRFNSSAQEQQVRVSSTTQLPATVGVATPSAPTRDDSLAQEYRPTLGPVQRLASWTGSTPPPGSVRNLSMVLTTLAPPPVHPSQLQTRNKSQTSNSQGDSPDSSGFDHRAKHTIVLIHSDDDKTSNQSTAESPSEKTMIRYDIGGYEGVDFDAQFPSLRKASASPTKQAQSTSGQNEPDQKRYEDKHLYDYSPLLNNHSADNRSTQKSRKPLNGSAVVSFDEDDSVDDMKLFPVARWPAMHRRTVSLVTSSGNKTMPDSSDKYKMTLKDSDKQGHEAGYSEQSNGTLQAQQVHRRRIKRDLNATNANLTGSNSRGKVGKRLIKVVKRRRLERPTEPVVSPTNASNDDPMLSDSSGARARFDEENQPKRPDHKSEPSAHIIATMVAQLDDPDDGLENETKGDSGLQRQPAVERDLREQLLRKKAMLDRLATNNMYYSPREMKRFELGDPVSRRPARTEPEEDEEESNGGERDLSSGGRARLPSAPVEVMASRVKVRKGSDGESRAKQRNKLRESQDEEIETNLVLADDTRKALTKFGSLLIKDTLQIPHSGGPGRDEPAYWPAAKTNNSSTGQIGRRKLAANHNQVEREEEADGQELSATERSFSRTTPLPTPIHQLRSLQYRQDLNQTNHTPHHDSQFQNYSSSQYRSSGAPMRDQVNLIPDLDHIGGGYGPPDEGARFLSRENQRGDFSPPMSLVASRYAQPDRYSRPELYSNYSGSREPSIQSYGSYYSRPMGREPAHQAPVPGPHYDSMGHHYSPAPSSYLQPYQNASAYQVPSSRPADHYYDARRDHFGAPAYSSNEQHHYNKFPLDTRHPAASQEHESWPPRLGGYEQREHQPGYASSQPSFPPQVQDRDSAYSNNNSPAQQQVAPSMSRSIAGDSSAVNEYLKRVQFSDSDRDKLMASYLTCDGLLNDNDHCLERLSCEFSDPQNIDRANKLDRAVSSILLGHILINTYIPNQFKLRLKSASLFGYTNTGGCSKYVCNKLAKPPSSA